MDRAFLQALGGRLKAARQRAGYANREEAETDVGLLPRGLEPFEQGRRVPSLPLLEQLATAYGVHPAVLLYGPESLRGAASREMAETLRRTAAYLATVADEIQGDR